MCADNTRLPSNLARWRKGEKITAKKLSQTTEALNRGINGAKPGKQLSTPTPAPAVRAFVVKAEYDDYLECVPFGAPENQPSSYRVLVYKPWMLRKSTFQYTPEGGGGEVQVIRAGITYDYTSVGARTATRQSDSETEEQVIVPGYEEGDVILAIRGVLGEPDSVIWVDLNTDARAWALDDSA